MSVQKKPRRDASVAADVCNDGALLLNIADAIRVKQYLPLPTP